MVRHAKSISSDERYEKMATGFFRGGEKGFFVPCLSSGEKKSLPP
jgi:hypothetical protein